MAEGFIKRAGGGGGVVSNIQFTASNVQQESFDLSVTNLNDQDIIFDLNNTENFQIDDPIKMAPLQTENYSFSGYSPGENADIFYHAIREDGNVEVNVKSVKTTDVQPPTEFGFLGGLTYFEQDFTEPQLPFQETLSIGPSGKTNKYIFAMFTGLETPVDVSINGQAMTEYQGTGEYDFRYIRIPDGVGGNATWELDYNVSPISGEGTRYHAMAWYYAVIPEDTVTPSQYIAQGAFFGDGEYTGQTTPKNLMFVSAFDTNSTKGNSNINITNLTSSFDYNSDDILSEDFVNFWGGYTGDNIENIDITNVNARTDIVYVRLY